MRVTAHVYGPAAFQMERKVKVTPTFFIWRNGEQVRVACTHIDKADALHGIVREYTIADCVLELTTDLPMECTRSAVGGHNRYNNRAAEGRNPGQDQGEPDSQEEHVTSWGGSK